MSEISEADVLAQRLADCLARPADADPWRTTQARTLTTRCLLEIGDAALLLVIERGVVKSCTRGLPLLAEWEFAIRGSARAWHALWETLPAPGWHDLFALSKRGEMRFEGRLHPLMAHLQYFKDLLALPRELRR